MLKHTSLGFFLILLFTAVLSGCSSTAAKDERSAAINASGAASIENWRSPMLKTTRVFVTHVDGSFLQTGGQRGVYPLTPGPHILTVQVHFSRLAPQLIIDAGGASITFEARPSTRYRLRAEKGADLTAELWIENVARGEAVTPRTKVDLTANPQDIPIIIPIPV